MTALDYAVIGVGVISVAWGVWHGLVREVISLAGWVIAFVAANVFAGPLAGHLPASLSQPQLRTLIAFVAVFLLALTATTLVGMLLSRIVNAVGLGGLDRSLGALFGLARALLIAVAFALLAGLTRLPLHPIWKDSASGAPLARMALYLKPWLPTALAERLRYH